jgi:cell pole-organizing protein PopZ
MLEVSTVTTKPREQHEPSMEEILSSIRRIISDEDAEGADDADAEERAGSGAARARLDSFEEEERTFELGGEDDDSDDVLELTKVVRESGEVVELKTGAGNRAEFDADHLDAVEDQEEAELAPPDDMAEEESDSMTDEDINREDEAAVYAKQSNVDELVSTTAASAVSGSIAKLTSAFRTPAEESIADTDGRTMEQFAEDIMRPMLKEWLDEHLPPMIERIVEKEIRKIARRAEAL